MDSTSFAVSTGSFLALALIFSFVSRKGWTDISSDLRAQGFRLHHFHLPLHADFNAAAFCFSEVSAVFGTR